MSNEVPTQDVGKNQKRGMNLAAGLIPLIIGIVFMVASLDLRLGQLSSPGPGMWPFILSAVIILASIGVLIGELRRKSDILDGFTKKSKYVFFGILAIGAFILLFEYTGLIISSLALLFLWMKLMGKEAWRIAIILTIAITALVYVLFSLWLNIPFPRLF